MTEIKRATDEDIAIWEKEIPSCEKVLTRGERKTLSLIARIRAERENTIRECADAANEAWLDGTPISMMRMSILALSKRSQP